MVGFRYVGLGVVLAVSLIGFGSAAASTYTATPVQIGSTGQIPGTGPQVRFEVRSPTHGTRYGNALVPVSAASLGKMALRAATTNIPLHLAIMAFVAAKENWDWDSVEHKFHVPGQEHVTSELPTCSTDCNNFEGTCRVFGGANAGVYGGTGLYHAVQGAPYPSVPSGAVLINHCTSYPSYSGLFPQKRAYPFLHALSQPTGTSQGQDITTSQVGESLSDPATATQTATLIRTILQTTINNPTTINNDWPEMTTVRTNIANSFTNYDVNVGDDFVDSSVETDVPIFCEWAPKVCDFIDWFQEPSEEPDHPEIPEEEPEMVEWESGLGDTGSCPAPYVTSFMGQEISVPFDDVCWGAESVFRPLLIALSLIAAGFILVGVRGTA